MKIVVRYSSELQLLRYYPPLDFVKLCEALRSWTRRNPIEKEDKYRKRNTKVYNTQHHEVKVCVYCGEPSHKGIQCQRFASPRERKKILAEKKLCFNCTGPRHRAADCKSTTGCQLCSKRHHTSICETKKPDGENMMSTCDGDKVIHPIVVIKVDGVECRALVDSGAASCYASSKLLDSLGKKPTEVKYKKVEMLMASTTTRMEIHNSTISSKSGDYELEVDLIKVNKGTLLEVENPQYKELIESYSHLKGVKMDDYDTKPYLPVHVILGAGVFAKIKTDSRPRVWKQGDPVAEHTKLGWFILNGFPVTDMCGWTDSLVVLHWIRGGGQYKQFVENRVRKIQAKPEIKWRHVPTEENPADLASRGGDVQHNENVHLVIVVDNYSQLIRTLPFGSKLLKFLIVILILNYM